MVSLFYELEAFFASVHLLFVRCIYFLLALLYSYGSLCLQIMIVMTPHKTAASIGLVTEAELVLSVPTFA